MPEKKHIDLKELKRLIEEGVSISHICKKYKISKTTFYRLKEDIKDIKLPKYKNKDWLRKKYIEENLSTRDIAKLLDTNKTTILRYIKKFELEKDEDIIKKQISEKSSFSKLSFKKKVISTSKEKRGVDHPHQDPSVRRKYYKTMKNNWGVNYPLQSDKIYKKYKDTMKERWGEQTPLKNKKIYDKYLKAMEKYKVDLLEKNISDKAHTRIFHGKTLKELAKENNISYTSITKFLKDKDNINEQDFLDFLNKERETSLEFLLSKKFNIDFYNKKILSYRPDFKIYENIYLNIDGLYWHSELRQSDRWYHFNMRKEFEENKLQILQFRADEIYCPVKSRIVESMILNKMKKIQNKIGARKCNISYVDHKEASSFLQDNHLMGSTTAKHIALIFKEKIISILSFKEYKDKIKVERFASLASTVVPGGLSRLLKFLEKETPSKDIHYWVDLRYGTGKHLLSKGFHLEKETLGWKWTDFKNTYNRLKCRANMDDRGLTQKQHSEELGWYKIYDAGQRLYIKERN